MAVGTVVRFDEVKGYGFVSPDDGDEDVFIHANDLLLDKRQLVPGVRVEFQLEDGERGPKASRILLVDAPRVGVASTLPVRTTSGSGPAQFDDDVCDILSGQDYLAEVTEALLTGPELTGAQIVRIRQQMLRIAEAHGWVEIAPGSESRP